MYKSVCGFDSAGRADRGRKPRSETEPDPAVARPAARPGPAPGRQEGSVVPLGRLLAPFFPPLLPLASFVLALILALVSVFSLPRRWSSGTAVFLFA